MFFINMNPGNAMSLFRARKGRGADSDPAPYHQPAGRSRQGGDSDSLIRTTSVSHEPRLSDCQLTHYGSNRFSNRNQTSAKRREQH